MENNSKIDEQIKQYEGFINKIEDDIININGIPTSKFENIDPNSTGFGGKYNMGVNPCEHCPNNPKNNPFSSGFCNCALPALSNPIY
jgi:hypothetical protein